MVFNTHNAKPVMRRHVQTYLKVEKKHTTFSKRIKNALFFSDNKKHTAPIPPKAMYKGNPYKLEKTDWRKHIFLFIGVLCATALGYLLLFYPFFFISEIHISGLQRIDQTEFTQAVGGIMNYKKFYLFPANSYIVADVDEIHDILMNRYPINNIVVTKTFPNRLDVTVEEKISTIIYDNGKQYSYVGLDGQVIELLRKVGDDEWLTRKKIVTSTNEQGEMLTEEKELDRQHLVNTDRIQAELGEYPIIFDHRQREVVLNAPALKSKTVNGVIEWYNLISKRSDIPFGYISIDSELGEGTIHLKDEAWTMRVRFDAVQAQFDALTVLLEEKIKRSELSYIDLRYGDRVYWK